MATPASKPRKNAAAKAAPALAAAAEPAADLSTQAPELEAAAVAVSLDLDTLSKFDVIDDAVEEEFTIRLKGHVFSMIDPRDIDWQDVFQSLRNPVMFMRYAMPADQQDLFYSLRMPAWQLGVVMERWHKHYKMADPSDLAKLITG
jgi:hypothetical protein